MLHHFRLQVYLALNVRFARFPHLWTGRNWSTVRHPRSPNLIPHDFFFISSMWKAVFILKKIRDSDHLKQRITAALATSTMGMLHHIWAETEYRLDVFRFTSRPVKVTLNSESFYTFSRKRCLSCVPYLKWNFEILDIFLMILHGEPFLIDD
jgi:hypothetical protein